MTRPHMTNAAVTGTMMATLRARVAVATFAALALAATTSVICACSSDAVGDYYFAFLDRADRTPAPLEVPPGAGVLVDVTGDYLFNIDLGGAGLGEVKLELKVTFDTFTLLTDEDSDGDAGVPIGAIVSGAFRFPDESNDTEPLTTFTDVEVDEFGRMELDLGFVRIEPQRSPIENTAVEVEFKLQVVILDEMRLCGVIDDDTSNVSQPIQILLRGVTFGAQRYESPSDIPTGVASGCPPDFGGEPEPEPDAGTDVGPDVEVDPDADGGLTPPDVDLGDGVRADISGAYWMSVGVAGGALSLNFYVDIIYSESDSGEAAVIGALRHTADDPGAPAIAVFTESVNSNGEFVALVPGLRVPSRLGVVEADVALLGIIRDADFWCGAGAGQVFRPIAIDLDGTRFGAVRLPADFERVSTDATPEFARNSCDE